MAEMNSISDNDTFWRVYICIYSSFWCWLLKKLIPDIKKETSGICNH